MEHKLKQEERTKHLGIKVKTEIHEGIRELAALDRRSVSSYLQILLEEHIAKNSPKTQTKEDPNAGANAKARRKAR